MARVVVSLVLTTPTALALTPPTRPARLPGRRAVAVAAAPAALPTLAAACAVPTCLGFYKREYGVSYGYGLSIGGAAGLVLRAEPTGIARAHALVHVCYGVRLCAFLLWRELSVAKFRKLREKIERSAPQGSRLKRACLLYTSPSPRDQRGSRMPSSA